MVKNLPANAGDTGSIPGPGTSSGEGNGNPFQHSYLENFMDRGAWRATVHGFAKKLDTTWRPTITKTLWPNETQIPKQGLSPLPSVVSCPNLRDPFLVLLSTISQSPSLALEPQHPRSQMSVMEGGGDPGVGLYVDLGLGFPTKPCPEAIDEIFRSKFHIIGAVGIGIAVVMVSVRGFGKTP